MTKKYIQLQDSYDSKKGYIWEESAPHMGYFNKDTGLYIPRTTLERNPDWFAPYEEKKEYAKSWDSIRGLGGYYISETSKIESTGGNYVSTGEYSKNIFATENQAKSALAESQLSQLLMEIYKGDNWFPDWEDGAQGKHCIIFENGILYHSYFSIFAQFIALPTKEIAEQFLENHRELIETFFLKFKY